VAIAGWSCSGSNRATSALAAAHGVTCRPDGVVRQFPGVFRRVNAARASGKRLFQPDFRFRFCSARYRLVFAPHLVKNRPSVKFDTSSGFLDGLWSVCVSSGRKQAPEPMTRLLRGRRPRVNHRPRHYVPRPVARILGATLFRYSPWRDAYVLRLVGRHRGPVIRSRH
jgi:hypothetical protein